jgi:NADH:ubiquinone oxidoreductase subunit 5 (subunit L)/multisubunit Na+/H+ antiporter MnhA subunit
MNYQLLIPLFALIPLVAFGISLIMPRQNERLLSFTAFSGAALNLIVLAVFLILWWLDGHRSLDIHEFTLYQSDAYVFMIEFFVDRLTAVYLMLGGLLVFMITVYSRYYLHREPGYKRFFNTILFFFFGFNVTVLAGNFETLFLGWECIGLSSFLLIAFYRDRYLPVRNAVKVFSIYRIGDVGILMAMWASHHLWKGNISFARLQDVAFVDRGIALHGAEGLFIAIMLLLAAAVKSAQLPFSSWLPRAMEGPTPSSAIFYGSLSVHFGVFLLLRTYPFWEHQYVMRVMTGVLGALTAIIASLTARVQSSVKTQIAYASVAQIGLIFIEIALGLPLLALWHTAGNAFLRTYQLLVSPSVVSYLIREQIFGLPARSGKLERLIPVSLRNTVFVLSLKEWNLDAWMSRLVFNNFKLLGRRLYLGVYWWLGALTLTVWMLQNPAITPYVRGLMAELFSGLGLVSALAAFAGRKSAKRIWLQAALVPAWVGLALTLNISSQEPGHLLLYWSGIFPAALGGWLFLKRLERLHRLHSLFEYQGLAVVYPRSALLFLLLCLAMAGFPITPTFIGEDLIFSHIREDQFLLAILNTLSFIFSGIALMRLYARLFLGPFKDPSIPQPLRSS